MVSQTYDLNLIPGSEIVVVHVSQYDVGRLITFNLFKGSSPYSPEVSTTATIDGTKPDKKGFSLPANISGTTASFVTTKNMCAVPGKTICEFRLSHAQDQNVGTANFILDVERAGLADDVDISETELPEYIDAAHRYAKKSEAWAVGTEDGEAVPASHPAYQNYSKYHAEQAGIKASQAAYSATAAATGAGTATSKASDAEAWAVGKRSGQDVPPIDPTYHNNSKFFAEIAEALIEGGIPEGTTVAFWVSGGHLWVQQTIDGVQQEEQDLGQVSNPDFVFDTAAQMSAAIAGGTVPNGSTCYVREGVVYADTTSY